MSRAARMMRRQALKGQAVEASEPLAIYRNVEPANPWARYRVAIASPMMDMCHSAFTACLARLVAHTIIEAPGIKINFLQCSTSLVPVSRQLLVALANDQDFTHMLWIDSDMTFPDDLLLRMLSHGKDIVAANCIARRPPFRMTAQVAGQPVETTVESKGLQRVDRIGTGVVLTSLDVFRKMPLPWFSLEWIEEQKIFRGEDYVFSDKAKKAGFDLWVDHDVSKQIEHLGQFGLNPLMYARIREMMEGKGA